MNQRTEIVKPMQIAWILIAGMIFGCAAKTPHFSGEPNGAASNPDINLERVNLSLDRIEPVPAKPVKPDTYKPLSERAARQITKADRLIAQQRYTEAAIELERALRYDPNHPDIHRSLAILHWQAGNLERTKTHVAKALQGNPDDAIAHFIEGLLESLNHHPAAAITAYRTALLCSDLDSVAEVAVLCHYHLAEALAEEGYLTAALSQYEAFEANVGRIHEPLRFPDQASLAVDGAARSRHRRSVLLERLGRFARAADTLAPLVTDPGKDPALSLRYASLLLRGGRPTAALEAARAIPSDEKDVLALLFEIHERLGHPDGVLDDLQTRLQRNPDNQALVVAMADTLIRLGRTDEARRQLQALLAKKPDAEMIRAKTIDLAIDEHLWDEALKLAAEGTAANPDHDQLFTAKIKTLASNQDAVTALTHGDNPADTQAALFLRGVLALEADLTDRATALLRRANTMDSGFVPVRLALADAYLRKYRYDEALAVAKRADKDVPEDARLEHTLGVVYERLDRYDDAERHFRAAIQLDRNDAASHLALARLYQRTRRRLQAQRLLRVLLEHDPDQEEARELLANTYLVDRKPDVAVEEYEALRRRTASPLVKARCDAMLAQIQRPDPRVYRKTLRKAIDKYGGDATTWIAIAESYNPQEDPAALLHAYEQALKHDPDNEDAAWGWVRAAKQTLDFEGAARRLSAMLPRRPNRDQWRLSLIDLYWIIQDYPQALSLAEEAQRRDDLDSRQRRAYRGVIVDLLRRMDRGREALTRIRRWMDDAPEETQWRIMLANEYLRQDQPESAVPLFEKMYANDPNRGTLGALLTALEEAEHDSRATQYLLDWINDDPENDLAIDRLSGTLARAKRYDDALELINNRLLHTSAREALQEREIQILRLAKRYETALDMIESYMDEVVSMARRIQQGGGHAPRLDLADKDITRLPDEPFTLENLQRRLRALRIRLGQVLTEAKEYTTAENQLSTWLEETHDPGERFGYLRLLAFTYQQQGRDQEAYEVEARALVLRPDDPGMNNDVAYGWISQGVQLEEAAKMIRYALSRNPRNSAFLDTYGWLLYKQGDFSGAETYLKRSLGIRMEADPVVANHLGDTLWRLGRKDQALNYWKKALEAAEERSNTLPASGDERNVRKTVPEKIEAVKAGREPEIAPLATPGQDQPSDDKTEPK